MIFTVKQDYIKYKIIIDIDLKQIQINFFKPFLFSLHKLTKVTL